MQQAHEPGTKALQIKISLRDPSCPSWLKVLRFWPEREVLRFEDFTFKPFGWKILQVQDTL
jgi:hypothetical protein